jgi:AsmA protein
MDVKVEGRLRLGFTPGLHVKFANVRVSNRGTQLAFVEEGDLAVEFLSLLRKDLRYGDIVLKRAHISVESDRHGDYNFERPAEVEAALPALELEKVSIAGMTVAYADKASGAAFETGNCDGVLTGVRHPGGAGFLSRVSLSGQFACSEVPAKRAPISDLKFSVEAKEGVFDFKPITMRSLGGEGSGTLHVDHSGAVPVIHLEYALKQFRIDEYFKALLPGVSASGLMHSSITLSLRGRTRGELSRSAEGEMVLSGTNLTLAGVDLDQDLSRYESSQNFNLFDLTAFVFAGPLGLAVTKGAQFASLAGNAGGSTPIRTVVSKWKIEKGVAQAKDVALTTRENRLALHGGLDFVNDDFDDVVVALVDSKGCAKVRQKIRGSFRNPVVEKPAALASITGPLRNLVGKLGSGSCEVFYSGSVAPAG